MNYQSRSSRLKSLTRNDDSLYWSAIDTFSNVTDATRSSSRQSISALSRNYIDPWDLENYAYIQRWFKELCVAKNCHWEFVIFFPPEVWNQMDLMWHQTLIMAVLRIHTTFQVGYRISPCQIVHVWKWNNISNFREQNWRLSMLCWSWWAAIL